MSEPVCFRELPFPSIPATLIEETRVTEEVMAQKAEDQATSGKRRTAVKVMEDGNEKTVSNAYYAAKTVFDKEVEKWVVANIPFLAEFPGSFRIAEQAAWGSSDHTPHVDRNRLSQLLIVVELGGDAVETSWYREPGQPIVRTEYMGNIADATSLERICSTIFKPNTWYYFNSKIIHGVRNIQGKRRAICVNLMDEEIMQYVQKNYLQ